MSLHDLPQHESTAAPSTTAQKPPSALPAAVDFEPLTVDLAAVAPHPANPRKDLGDLSDLTPSIGTQGVLQPPVLLPADRVAAAWPQHAEKLAGVQWVVLIGHRRRAAAIAVDRTMTTALVRRDAIADDPLAQVDAMIAENTARRALTPLEEARAFSEQIAAGRTQREVAERSGRSQGHVSKRLKLLRLPTSMLRQLETGQDDDQGDEVQEQRVDQPQLEIGQALAYVDAAGDGEDAQFLMLTAAKLAEHRPHWSPGQLVQEVRREKAAQVQREALAKKAEDEGLTLIEDPRKEFGPDYWQHRLDGKKAISQARKDGTLVATITSGGLAYYSRKPPRKADNVSEHEQQRRDDERERRKAMAARAEAAAVLVASPPKLPASAKDIVEACIARADNDTRQLARKWLVAASAGPGEEQSPYPWWEQLGQEPWPVQVQAAHAVALARHEVNTRGYWRKWNEEDAAWLARLAEVGYVPSAWEQAKLDAIGQEEAEQRAPEVVALAFDASELCWVLFYDLEVDEPAATADQFQDPEAVDEAKAWAVEVLLEDWGIEVTGWEPGQVIVGEPAHIATFAAAGPEPTGGEPVGERAEAGEYRLLYSSIDDAWMLLRGDEHLADRDGLAGEDLDGACGWASGVVVDDAGREVTGWQSRSGIGDGGVEHVAELGDTAPAAAEAVPAEQVAPRLVWVEGEGWSLYGADAELVAAAGVDIQAEDLVTAQAWAAEMLAADGVDVVRWTECPDGQPGYTAVVAS